MPGLGAIALTLLSALPAACAGAPVDEPGRSGEPGGGAGVVLFDPAPMGTRPQAPAEPPDPFELWRRREPIYELYVRHFSDEGTFAAVEERLPELRALGIGIVWLLPVNQIGSIWVDHGKATDAPHGNPYAVKDHRRINAEYGRERTEESAEADLASLVATAHELGMRVILDWVPNHTAWDNPLLEQHPDWYVWKDGAVQPVSDQFPWIAQLDWSKQGLREYMTEVMVDWTERYQLDGFRIDFAHSMPLDWFDELRAELELVRPVFLLAEAGAVGFHPTFDMTYDWDLYPLFGEVASGAKPVTALDDALLNTQLLPYADMPEALVMRMTYNHDDNGKFTLAERYRGGIRTFAVLAATLPGKPLVFDGQEAGMRVFDGAAVQDSINLGHDPKVKIDWSDPDDYRSFYTKLLQLFRANPALHQPGMADFRKIDTAPEHPAYSFMRRAGEDAVLVVLNLSAQQLLQVALQPAPNAGSIEGTYVELFTGETQALHGGTSMDLAPWEYRVYVRGPLHGD